MQKSGKSFTEAYADHVRLQNELATKDNGIDRLDRTLTEVEVRAESESHFCV